MTTLGASPVQNLASAMSLHPAAEPMNLAPSSVVRLIRPFHGRLQKTRRFRYQPSGPLSRVAGVQRWSLLEADPIVPRAHSIGILPTITVGGDRDPDVPSVSCDSSSSGVRGALPFQCDPRRLENDPCAPPPAARAPAIPADIFSKRFATDDREPHFVLASSLTVWLLTCPVRGWADGMSTAPSTRWISLWITVRDSNVTRHNG